MYTENDLPRGYRIEKVLEFYGRSNRALRYTLKCGRWPFRKTVLSDTYDLSCQSDPQNLLNWRNSLINTMVDIAVRNEEALGR